MDLQKEIDLVLSYEASKSEWRNNHPSDKWRAANKVARLVMGEGLSKLLNCGCLEDLFIMLKSLNKNQIERKQKVMNGKFKLKVGTVLMSHGGVDVLTPENCTDEKAIKALTANPKLIKKFEVVPEDWEEICKVDEEALAALEASKNNLDADNTGAGNDAGNDNGSEGGDERAELLKLGEAALRIAADKVAEDSGKRKAHHNAGDEKLVDYILENK